jgi:hypothetical protein
MIKVYVSSPVQASYFFEQCFHGNPWWLVGLSSGVFFLRKVTYETSKTKDTLW